MMMEFLDGLAGITLVLDLFYLFASRNYSYLACLGGIVGRFTRRKVESLYNTAFSGLNKLKEVKHPSSSDLTPLCKV